MERLLSGLLCFGILCLAGMVTADPGHGALSANSSDAVMAVHGLDSPQTTGPEENRAPPDLIQSGTRLFSATLVVIALLALGSYGVRRFMNHRSFLSGSGTMIRVVTTRSLGARSSLAVIEIGEARFVIGVSPQRISFLTALGGGDNGDGLLREASGFARELQKSTEKGGAGS